MKKKESNEESNNKPKSLLRKIGVIILFIIAFLLIIYVWHHIMNSIEEKNISVPGDKIEIYENEYIHSVKMGNGRYTLVLLPGMGNASPFYDFYKLANKLSEYNTVIIYEPFGYGFSDFTSKERSLDNYEYELSKMLDYYNIKEDIILVGHSYSGISNLNYVNKHNEVKGLVCLDCTTAYQIETHVSNGKFSEEVPSTSSIYTIFSPMGLTRLAMGTIMVKSVDKELLADMPNKYHKNYKHFLYNNTLNKTIVNEVNGIYYNQLEMFNIKYRDDLNVLTILSDETVESMKQYKKDGDFKKDWEEMHQALISNNSIQHIYTLHGNHYIYHGNVDEITNKINDMINEIK